MSLFLNIQKQAFSSYSSHNQICIYFTGSKNKNIVDKGHDKNALHGRGTAYSRNDAERLFRKLVIDGVLYEELKIHCKCDLCLCFQIYKSRHDQVTAHVIKFTFISQDRRIRT